MGQRESARRQNTHINSSGADERKLLKRCENIPFDVEAWYKILQDQTFHTQFIPICPATAQAFVNYYQRRYNSKDVFSTNDLQLIQSIQHQLKENIFYSQHSHFQMNGTFVRLSSRSPKDGNPLDSRKLIQLFDQEVNRLQTNYPSEYHSVEGKANIQMMAFSFAQFHCLRVTNELEALNLILSSERVFVDLLDALACHQVQNDKVANTKGTQLHEWNNNIVIREWNNSLDPSMEFRCFVYQSKLTAISQYNHYCKFYQFQNDFTVQQIKVTIVQYWQQKVKPLLDPLDEQYSNYVIDLGLFKNGSSKELGCIVIELNPFASSTGASLFDWRADHDQLTGKLNETEIRIRSNYFPNIQQYSEFIIEEHMSNIGDQTLSNRMDHEPYQIFLQKIQTSLSS